MYVEIKNFGPIEYLKIDLEKDLHLIYGRNAIGKSYAIYCLYCLLKNIKDKDLTRRYYPPIISKTDEFFKDFTNGLNIKEQKDKRSKTKDITFKFVSLIKKELQSRILDEFQNSLLNTFSSLDNLKNRYSNKEFEIIINLPHSDKCKKIKIFKGKNDNLDIDVELAFDKLEFVEKPTKTTKYSIYLDGRKLYGKPTEQDRVNALKEFFLKCIVSIYHELNANMREIYFLPASRSGLYQALSSFAPIIAELTQSRFFISKKIELPTLSEPVSDYYIDLSTIDKKLINKEFTSLVKVLESDILNGRVGLDEETKNIIYEPKGLDIKLNLSEASSMVAELSPFVLYLKHIINHKFQPRTDPWYLVHRKKRSELFDILFIEEPEAHLHPEVQVSLMKVFAQLVKHNLKVFITSHSNYMFHELNNIILDKKIETKKIAVYHLVQNDDGSTQNMDMTITDEGIDDENFQETSEKLYEERMRILEEVEND